jgi:hypothetical protein
VAVPQLPPGGAAVVELAFVGTALGYARSPALLISQAGEDGQPLHQFTLLVEAG